MLVGITKLESISYTTGSDIIMKMILGNIYELRTSNCKILNLNPQWNLLVLLLVIPYPFQKLGTIISTISRNLPLWRQQHKIILQHEYRSIDESCVTMTVFSPNPSLSCYFTLNYESQQLVCRSSADMAEIVRFAFLNYVQWYPLRIHHHKHLVVGSSFCPRDFQNSKVVKQLKGSNMFIVVKFPDTFNRILEKPPLICNNEVYCTDFTVCPR